jgi:hypothetical protein
MSDCKWCKDGVCVNADSPLRADFCMVVDIPGICKFEDRSKFSMEKLEKLIEDDYGSIEEDLVEYLQNHRDVFDIARVANLISNLLYGVFLPRAEQLENCVYCARENAVSLKKYLEGNMYDSEEAAKANVGCQIENAQRIIDLCDGKVDAF